MGEGCADLGTLIGEAIGLWPNIDESTEELLMIRDPFREPGRDAEGDGGGKTRTAPGISSGRIPGPGVISLAINSCCKNSSSTFCSNILTLSLTLM